jgi:hypothetical protein
MNLRKSLLVSMLVISLISCNLVTELIGTGTQTTEINVTPLPEITEGRSPEIIHHPKPELAVDIKPFNEAGCSGENLYVMECAEGSPIHALGCDFLRVEPLFGGVEPPYPVATCLRREESGEPPDPSSFKMTGCLMPLYQSFLIALDGEFRLVSDADDFQAYFAPIESEDEALSYAQMVTGLSAVYGREVQPEPAFSYRVYRLEDTHVVETEGGYIVNLFSGPEPNCGCGIHTFYQHEVMVYMDGRVEITEITPLFDIEACFD